MREVRTSKPRVLRLMREHQLLAPQGQPVEPTLFGAFAREGRLLDRAPDLADELVIRVARRGAAPSIPTELAVQRSGRRKLR